MKRALCLLLCVFSLLSLCACGKQAEEPYSAVIWCAADDPLLPTLQKAAEDYNRSRKDGTLSVSLRAFDDEAALKNALNTARPDLLLCSHTLALPLYEEGLLSGVGTALPFPDTLAGRSEGIGKSIFPIGSRVQLLVSREALSADLESLCVRAAAYGSETRAPFLAADSYADLLCQNLLGSGEFHANRSKDCFSAAFQSAWNTLAEAAFSGGLYTGPEAAASLLRGGIPAALAFSDTLTETSLEDFTLTPLRGEGDPLLADLRCLAVMAHEGRQQRGTAAFLAWLFSGERACRLSLDAGLIPALPGGQPEAGLEELLLSLSSRALWLPDGGSDFVKNRAAFEADCRAALDLLK